MYVHWRYNGSVIGGFKFNYHKNVTIIFSIVVRLKLFFGKMNSSKANS